MPEELNDKPNAEESLGGSEKKKSYDRQDGESAKDQNEEVSPLGEGIIPAFYVVYNTKLGTFGIIGSPGFLEDRVRAYGALKMAEWQLNEYYAKMDKAKSSIITKVKNFDARQAFNRFIRRK